MPAASSTCDRLTPMTCGGKFNVTIIWPETTASGGDSECNNAKTACRAVRMIQ